MMKRSHLIVRPTRHRSIPHADARWSLVIKLVLAALLMAPAHTVHAQCVPDPASAGDTVTCTGNLGMGYAVDPGVDDVTVIIETGATITSFGDGVRVNDVSRVENRGTLNVNGILRITGITAGNGSVTTPTTITNSVTGAINANSAEAVGVQVGSLADITNEGAITAAGENSVGIQAGNDANVGNSGSIDATGIGSVAIRVGNDSVVTNSGTMRVSGEAAFGAIAGNSSNVDNRGTLILDGTGSAGIATGDGSGTSRTTITNSATGVIQVNSDQSIGMRAGLLAEATNEGAIAVSGSGGGAISIGSGDGTTASLVTNAATGSLTLSGTDSIGMIAGDRVLATNEGMITGAGTNAIGVQVGGGSAVVNSGTIALSGDDSRGVITGNSTSVTNEGSIDAAGLGSTAIRAGNDTVVSNAGTILVTGQTAFGVQAGNDANLTHTGILTVSGQGAVGLSSGIGATIENEGQISLRGATTKGIDAGAIAESILNAEGARIDIEAGANGGIGINTGSGAKEVRNRGLISVAAQDATAISVSGGRVENEGRIEATGVNVGALVDVGSARMTNTLDGSIVMTGANSRAITTGSRGRAINLGSITLSGNDSQGMLGAAGISDTAATIVLNGPTGSIVMTGDGSTGLEVAAFGFAQNDGTVFVQGTNGTGIKAGSDGAATNQGALWVQTAGAIGIAAEQFDPSLHDESSQPFFNIWNRTDSATGMTGSILSDHPDAGPLIQLRSVGAIVGLNRARNDAGAVIRADLTNLGMPGRAMAIQGSSGPDEIINAGTIEGRIELGADNDVYSQSASGSFVDIGPGWLDGGVGSDQVRLNAELSTLGRFRADAIQNFETLHVDGYWSIQGASPVGLDLIIEPGGTLRLDTPLLVNGNVSLTAPGTGQASATVEAFLGGPTSGVPEILHATNTATLATGTLEVVVGGGIVGSETFTILRADTDLIGQFASVLLPTDPGLAFGPLVYDDAANTLSLSVSAAPYSANQTAVSNALDRIEAAGASAPLQSVLDGLNGLDYRSYRQAMDQLQPEAYDAHTAATLELANRYTQLMLERPRHCIARPGESSVDPRTKLSCRKRRFEPWISLYGQLGNRTGKSGQTSYSDQGAGLVVGLDHRISDRFIVGGTVGTAYDSLEVDGVGRGRFTTLDLGLYGGYSRGALRVQGAASYGYGWQKRFRNIRIPGFVRTAEAEWGSQRIGTRLETEYAFDLTGVSLIPMASLDYTAMLQSGFDETGALPLSLRIGKRTDHIVTVRAGFELSTSYHKKDYWTALLETIDGVWRPTASVRWRQVVTGADRDITAGFIGAPVSPLGQFTITGDAADKGFEIGAGIDWTPRAANRLTFGVRYDLFVWTNVTSHDLVARVGLSF